MEPDLEILDESVPPDDRNIEEMLEFTKKIGSDPGNPANYVNRSRYFVKLAHYFYALEDARKLIYEVCPRSPVGYRLMSEIYSHAELYENAIKALEAGFQICGHDFKDYRKLKNLARHKLALQQKGERIHFFLFLLIGVATGIGLVFLNKKLPWPYILGKSQTTNFVVLSVCPLLSCVAYFISRHIRKRYREASAEPPYDIIGDSNMQSMRRLCPELSESLGDKKAF